MTDSLRIGYVGTGWPGRVQTRVFAEEGLLPAAVCSGNPDNARRMAEAHGIPNVFSDWRELVACSAVDLVSITTPPGMHAEMAMAALRSGKHVLCEAPVMDAGEAERLATAAGDATGMGLVDFELRFTPGVRRMRRLLREGALGRLLWLDVAYRYDYALDPTSPWSWEHDRTQGGGQLRMVAGHLVDLVLWLAGDAELDAARMTRAHDVRRTTSGQARAVTADDHTELHLSLVNGASATVTASAITRDRQGVWISAHGSAGSAVLDADHRLWLHTGHGEGAGTEEVALPDSALARREGGYPFALGTRLLARALAAHPGTAPEDAAGFQDLLKVQRILDAAARAGGEDQGRSSGRSDA